MRKTTLLPTLRVFMLLLVALVAGGGKALAEETLYKTLTFSAETNGEKISAYNKTWTATIDGFTWDIANFNNNNNGWNYIKCGSKKFASVANITNKTLFDKPVSKVVVTIDKVTAAYVNSVKLTTHAGDASSAAIDTIEAKTIEAGAMTFNVADPNAANVYQLVFDCKQAKSNGIVQVSKVEYYTGGTGTGEVENAAKAPSLTASCEFEGDSHEVTITNNEQGATVYYTTDGSEPTTASESFTGESKTLTLTTTTTVKAMAAIKGKDNSRTVTATYTKAAPAATYENIAAFIAAAPDKKAKLKLTNALVYGNKDNRSIFLHDGTAMIQLYDGKNGLPAAIKYGTRVTATVEGTYKLYYGQDEVDTAVVLGEPVITEVATPYEGQEVTAAEVNDGMVGQQVTVKGVTFQADKLANKQVIVKDGETSLTIYNSLGVTLPTEFRTDVKANVSGFVLKYVNKSGVVSMQIIPEAADFVTYIQDLTKAATPTLTEEGEFEQSREVTITNNEAGATVYYTLDGTDPTLESDHFTGESKTLTLTATTTLKAMAVIEGKQQSQVAQATYTLVLATPDVTFAQAAIELPMGETTVPTNALTTNSDGAVAYESSDESVATVAQDGTVTLVAPGFTTITATTAATAAYQEGKASYTLLLLSGDGTWEHPYSPVDVVNSTKIEDKTEIWVKGIYVGCPTKTDNGFKEARDDDASMALSADADNTTMQNSVAIQAIDKTWRGTFCGTSNVGKEVMAFGPKAKAFGRNGLQQTSKITHTSQKLTIGQEGYATYYSSIPTLIPEGIEAGIITKAENGHLDIDYKYNAGEFVPSATGVLLKGAKGEYPLVFTKSSTKSPANNLLHGTLTDEETTAPEEGKDYLFYKLSLDSNGQNLGFYWGAENGAAFQNKGGHAYLAVEKTANAVKGFSITDLETGIHGVSGQGTAQGGAVYDLQGRRVQKAVRGIYIQNGRKFFVK